MSQNGKMNGQGHDLGVLPGQIRLGFVEPRVAHAIEWLRLGSQARHPAGCQCRKCLKSRKIVRPAVHGSDCNCGWCPICWAAAEIAAGRL